MMVEDKILLTARYAEGDMDETEKADFESRLLTDGLLQQHLADYQQIHQSLKMQLANDASDQQFKETLKGQNDRYFAATPKVISLKPFRKWISGIAAVLVVGLLVWAPWHNNAYQDFMDKNVMLVTDRGVEQLSDLDRAADRFNQKNFPAAKVLLEKLALQDSGNAMVNYFYGLTLMELSNFEEAKKVLAKTYDGESAFKYDAAFAITLIYIKQNQKETAKIWLKKIPPSYRNYNQVTALINDL